MLEKETNTIFGKNVIFNHQRSIFQNDSKMFVKFRSANNVRESEQNRWNDVTVDSLSRCCCLQTWATISGRTETFLPRGVACRIIKFVTFLTAAGKRTGREWLATCARGCLSCVNHLRNAKIRRISMINNLFCDRSAKVTLCTTQIPYVSRQINAYMQTEIKHSVFRCSVPSCSWPPALSHPIGHIVDRRETWLGNYSLKRVLDTLCVIHYCFVLYYKIGTFL